MSENFVQYISNNVSFILSSSSLPRFGFLVLNIIMKSSVSILIGVVRPTLISIGQIVYF